MRAQPGHGRAPRGGSAGTRRRRLGCGHRPDPGWDPSLATPAASTRGKHHEPWVRDAQTCPSLTGRSGRVPPGVRLRACGTAPGATRLRAPLTARPLRPSAEPRAQPAAPRHRQTPDTAARSLASNAGPASPAAATQGAARPAGRRSLLSIGQDLLSVTLTDGPPRRRGPAPALIDIIGARRGRPGCSRGWRAAGPVREPGSGAEAEEKEAKEKGSLEGRSAETQTSTANSPPSSSTHQAAAVAVSRNRELEI